MGFKKEIIVENKLRSWSWIVPVLTITTGGFLLFVLFLFMEGFDKNHFWLIIPSGFVLHAYIIVLVHEGVHRAISGNMLIDSIIINAAVGFVMIPIYAEFFRRYHLIHHAHTNETIDPLWPKEKKWLFENYKRIFVIVELIPILTTIVLLILGEKNRNKEIKGPKIRWHFVLLSMVISFSIAWLIKPTFLFIVGSVLIAGLIAKIRNWCEHTGVDETKESNTYWFPLGMGIGNHEAHHAHPKISWITNQYCLLFKKRDTNPVKTIYRMLFNKNHKHYLPKN